MSRYFIDSEFVFTIVDGRATVDPISIALVHERGEYLYLAVPPLLTPPGVTIGSFVDLHVLPVVDAAGFEPMVIPLSEWRSMIMSFIADPPDFWGDYAAFDYVVLSTVMGGFDRWPEDWPMHINDFQQRGMMSLASEIPHNALADAQSLKKTWGEDMLNNDITIPRSLAVELESAADWYRSRDGATQDDYITYATLRDLLSAEQRDANDPDHQRSAHGTSHDLSEHVDAFIKRYWEGVS